MNEELQEREIQIQKKTKMFLFSFDVLNFPALDFPRSICRKAGISKKIFLFRTLSYTTPWVYLYIIHRVNPKKYTLYVHCACESGVCTKMYSIHCM